jgi:hypothetical protein
MTKITVVDWVECGENRDLPDLLGCLGGFFERGMRWSDYLERSDEKVHRHAEALRSAIIEKGIRKTGYWHQKSAHGVPVFSDGSIAEFSFRAWGDIMAATWAEKESRDYCYLDFYYDPSEGLE